MELARAECATEAILAAFIYDPETGIITRRVDASSRAKAGSVAGSLMGCGYLRIGFQGKDYLAHRVAWVLMTGAWPLDFVDHRDRVRSNNAWRNLREATRVQNCVNAVRPRQVDLPRGAYPYGDRFGSYITDGGKKRWLGMYGTPSEAAEAYQAAAVDLHGAYAPA